MRPRRKITPQSRKAIKALFKRIERDTKKDLARFDARYDMLLDGLEIDSSIQSIDYSQKTTIFRNGKSHNI